MSTWPVALIVAAIFALALRRATFVVAALRRPRALLEPAALPRVSVLVPARDEAGVVPRLLAALSNLDYPRDRLEFVLVSDASSDDTAALFRDWAARHDGARTLELHQRAGKGAALATGLRGVTADVVVVVDADLQPERDFLREIVRPFGDPAVGAAAAYLAPDDPDQNAVTRYAAVTTWVHQLVTSAAADRLGLDPPTLGAAAYRRAALESIGGFPIVTVGEDVATSHRLARQGWRIRFVPSAIARNPLVASLRQYWHQHVRWARSMLLTAVRPVAPPSPTSPSPSPLPLPLSPPAAPTGAHALWRRLEATVAASGYADRLVFAVAVLGAALGGVPAWAPLMYLAMPAFAIVVALWKARTLSVMPRFLCATVALFAVDVAASASAVAAHLARQPARWKHPRQAPCR